MRQKKESNHFLLKVVLGIVVLFLIVVAVKDFTPAQTPVEKTVVYGQK
jgi:hypothetical protein